MEKFIKGLPKAELHLHLEGTLDAKLWQKLAKRNNIEFPYASIAECKKDMEFTDLLHFQDLIGESQKCLQTEEDFYELTLNYAIKCIESNTRHVELSWGPHQFVQRGISFETQMKGMLRAKKEAMEKYDVSVAFIMCILRDTMTVEDGMKMLEMAEPFRNEIVAMGLACAERGHPPSKFTEVFKVAKEKYGYKLTAHAGEEGDSSYVNEAIEDIKVDRIDHGLSAIHDKEVMQKIIDRKLHLTLCPCSNICLNVFEDQTQFPIKKFYDLGVSFSINSDDPPYFSNYQNDNYLEIFKVKEFGFKKRDFGVFARQSFEGSFLEESEKIKYIHEVNEYVMNQGMNLLSGIVEGGNGASDCKIL